MSSSSEQSGKRENTEEAQQPAIGEAKSAARAVRSHSILIVGSDTLTADFACRIREASKKDTTNKISFIIECTSTMNNGLGFDISTDCVDYIIVLFDGTVPCGLVSAENELSYVDQSYMACKRLEFVMLKKSHELNQMGSVQMINFCLKYSTIIHAVRLDDMESITVNCGMLYNRFKTIITNPEFII